MLKLLNSCSRHDFRHQVLIWNDVPMTFGLTIERSIDVTHIQCKYRNHACAWHFTVCKAAYKLHVLQYVLGLQTYPAAQDPCQHARMSWLDTACMHGKSRALEGRERALVCEPKQ